MRKDHTQRFNIHDGIAQLIPAAVPICPCCGVQDGWGMLNIDEKTFIVTLLCCYQAEGMAKIGGNSVITL